jgi:type II secretory pathway component PulF
MIAISSYFLLSVIVMPQFANLDMVYALAAHSGKKAVMDLQTLLGAVGLMVLTFLGGFGAMRKKMGRLT